VNYIDASALVPLIVTEPNSNIMGRFRHENVATIVIGDFAAGEVAATLARLVRMNMFEPDEAEARWLEFDRWRRDDHEICNTTAQDIALATDFVRSHALKLRLPDAIHAAICRRHGLTLVTLDVRLADAARALGIATIIPS